MCRKAFQLSSVFILVILFAVGCSRVRYVGESFEPTTTTVDLYFSKESIEKEYTVIGHALGSSFFRSDDEIQKELLKHAKRKGADAVLITGIGQAHAPIGESSMEESQINASFLKYK